VTGVGCHMKICECPRTRRAEFRNWPSESKSTVVLHTSNRPFLSHGEFYSCIPHCLSRVPPGINSSGKTALELQKFDPIYPIPKGTNTRIEAVAPN